MKVLLLGGTGFIGLHLFERLMRTDGLYVSTYSRHTPKVEARGLAFQHTIGDLLDTDRLFNAIKDVDVLIHLISSTVPSIADRNPKYDIETNLAATVSLFELIPHTTVKRVIYLSSGGTVYGNPQNLPVDEAHPLNPIGSYGIVKVAIEHYLRHYAEKYKFDYTILRVSNPYGPRQRVDGLQGVIATFLKKIVQGERIEIWGDGKSVRDYIYIDDLIDCLQLLIFHKEVNGVYNLGSGEGHSVIDIIDVIRCVTGLTPDISFTPSLTCAVDSTFLDISRIKHVLQWSPSTSLEDGVAKFYDWIKGTYPTLK